jgi:hypothetical protein
MAITASLRFEVAILACCLKEAGLVGEDYFCLEQSKM